MYLYLGYLLVHFYSLIDKLSQSDLSISAIIFSIVVIFIWSFIPFTGYLLAKFFKVKNQANKYALFAFGIVLGLIENSLFYFDILTSEHSNIGMFIIFILFFVIAFLPTRKVDFAETK